MVEYLHSPEFLKWLEAHTGIAGLIPDPHLHGGGFHRTVAGGHLDIHLDYSHHPSLGLERRLSLIVFINGDSGSGGQLEFWDAQMQRCVWSCEPWRNTAVLFENTDVSFHGHPTPYTSLAPRDSFACFYHTLPQVRRPRAQFFARPTDPFDPIKDEARYERAGLIKP